jgi:hypothetical protein
MMANAKQLKEKIILFPTAIDRYQVQLISYLEQERYGDALSLLTFLQNFSVDEQTSKEWHVLMTWLRGSIDEPQDSDLVEWTEEMFLRQRVQDQMEQEEHFADKVLDTLTQTSKMEKQLIALEQLSVVNHPQINSKITEWLENKQIHPLVQFKALQVLRGRNVKGVVRLHKNGQVLQCNIEATPLQLAQFPVSMRRVLNLVIEASEQRYASIGFFAEEIWCDFISYIYVTPLYMNMSSESETGIAAWASVLHQIVLESLQMSIDYEDLKMLYGVDPIADEQRRKAYILLKNYAQ